MAAWVVMDRCSGAGEPSGPRDHQPRAVSLPRRPPAGPNAAATFGAVGVARVIPRAWSRRGSAGTIDVGSRQGSVVRRPRTYEAGLVGEHHRLGPIPQV